MKSSLSSTPRPNLLQQAFQRKTQLHYGDLKLLLREIEVLVSPPTEARNPASRLHIYLQEDLHRRFKALTSQNGQSMSEVLRHYMHQYIEAMQASASWEEWPASTREAA
jgi:hypothetical protein